jgi:transcriptional regulator with XRE-family HTH domain
MKFVSSLTPRRKFRQLTETEKAIGQRVAVCRRFQRWDQQQLAGAIGLSRSQLSSIEIGRVALTTDAALRIAEVLKINLLWLAKELGGRIRFLKLPPELEKKARTHKHFSEAFDAVLRDYFITDWKAVAERGLAGFYSPEDSQIELPVPQNSLQGLKKDLTMITLMGNNECVKSEVQNLINRVKRKAAKPGAKAELARLLGVKPPRISEWLSGAKAPGGEYTLKLLRWVESP